MHITDVEILFIQLLKKKNKGKKQKHFNQALQTHHLDPPPPPMYKNSLLVRLACFERHLQDLVS